MALKLQAECESDRMRLSYRISRWALSVKQALPLFNLPFAAVATAPLTTRRVSRPVGACLTAARVLREHRGRLRNFLATLGSPTYIGTISEQRRLEASALDGANAWTTPNDERNSSRLASNVRSGFSGIRRKCADTTRQLPGQQFGRARRAANFVRRQVNGRFGQ